METCVYSLASREGEGWAGGSGGPGGAKSECDRMGRQSLRMAIICASARNVLLRQLPFEKDPTNNTRQLT